MVKEIRLPEPNTKGDISLEEAISNRRSIRRFADKGLTWEKISQILWSAQGITARLKGQGLRSCPSAGALYPMEIYLLSRDGQFLYQPEKHSAVMLGDKDLRSDLAAASLGQRAIAEAAAVFVICAVYERVTNKYGQRGIRYVDMEAGHIAQNLQLQAVTLGLASVPVGAFNDNGVKLLLGLPGEQVPLYIIPVGYAK